MPAMSKCLHTDKISRNGLVNASKQGTLTYLVSQYSLLKGTLGYKQTTYHDLNACKAFWDSNARQTRNSSLLCD